MKSIQFMIFIHCSGTSIQTRNFLQTETAKVLFPEGQDTPTLISQFLTYPDGYIDGCDALAGCLERFSEYDIRRNKVRGRSFVRPS